MKCAPVAMIALFLGCACGEPARDEPGLDLDAGRWIDLTHAFGPDTVYWPTAPGFKLTVDAWGVTAKGYFYASNSYQASEHGGTHLDAPIHFAADRLTTEKIPLAGLTGPGAVVNVRRQAGADADYRVTVADLEAWEALHGRLAEGTIVLLDTGYHRHWPDREKYMGTAERGADAVAKLRFPGLHPDAATWLVTERSIDAVGIDTPSIDYGRSTHFEAHRILFEKNVPAFENVANLGALPSTGAYVIALPMKIRKGSGGPLRIVAWLP